MAATEPVLTYDTKTFDVFMSPEEMYQMGKFKEAADLMNHYFQTASVIMYEPLGKEWEEIKKRNLHICPFPEDVFKEDKDKKSGFMHITVPPHGTH